MSQLICKNLLVGYEGKAILDPLNFEIHAGGYLCVVGENGAGKSTLMKTLLGLQQPISGQIEMGDGLRRNEIGYLPQQTIVQRDFPASVQEIVLSGCQSRCGLRPFYSREEKQLAQDAMHKMQIGSLAKRCYRELSGGQQQRVAIARGIVNHAPILMADEPTGNLDSKTSDEIMRLFQQLNREEGITIILVTHEPDVAAFAGRELLFRDGVILEDRPNEHRRT